MSAMFLYIYLCVCVPLCACVCLWVKSTHFCASVFAGQCALSVIFVCVCTVRLAGLAQGVKTVLRSGEGG